MLNTFGPFFFFFFYILCLTCIPAILCWFTFFMSLPEKGYTVEHWHSIPQCCRWSVLMLVLYSPFRLCSKCHVCFASAFASKEREKFIFLQFVSICVSHILAYQANGEGCLFFVVDYLSHLFESHKGETRRLDDGEPRGDVSLKRQHVFWICVVSWLLHDSHSHHQKKTTFCSLVYL